MFSRVLVATDLSPVSDALVECLTVLKGVGAEEVTLAHVIYIPLRYPDMGGQEEALSQLAAPKLESQRRRLEAAGFVAKSAMPVGVPHVGLDHLADEVNADLIVVGSRGESLLREVVLGSVAGEIIHHARRPVLVMRVGVVERDGAKGCEVACGDLFSSVLHPTDFSDNAERAFTYVESIVSAGCRAVTLLHVQDRVRLGTHLAERLEEFNQIDIARLKRLEERLRQLGAPEVTLDVPYGSPTSTVLERARSGKHTLIVMGSQGRGFIEEVFVGSVAHNVVRQAPIPVLLIPTNR